MPVTETQTTPKMKVDQSLDAKGLNCPLPVLKTKVLLNRMQPGEILYVEATDPHSVVDFEAYCARTNHELLKIIESDVLFEFYIRRAQQPKKY
jgi:tRNA 2-thiouridine synthesizing protein A